MIRINLLATERRGAKAASSGLKDGQKIVVIGSLLLVLTVALLGWRFWSLREQQAEVGRQIEAATREEQRLQEILKQVQDFENRRKVLESRVALIDELRKGQTAPVHMIDQVSKALPEMTWLTNMQQTGYTVTMQGRCLTLTSLSDFVGNLEASHYFMRPVEIIESSVVAAEGGKGPELIQFTIRATFQMAGVDSAPPPAPGSPAKGGRRG